MARPWEASSDMPHDQGDGATTSTHCRGPAPTKASGARAANANTAAWLCLAIAVAGCSSRYADIADVRGVVTLDGKPLAAATVLFQPAQGRASVGQTDAEGRYRLLYTPRDLGARIGPASVRITTTGNDEGKIGADERVPRRYFEPGALAAEVAPGSNMFDFNLTTTPEP